MIASIHQPAYLPWLGYFHKIMLSDVFVFFDTTQFEKNSFINRNKIKTSNGGQWLTVPVNLKDHFGKEIREIKIADQNWQKNHWQAIELNYKKAQYWPNYSDKLKKIYENKYDNISDLCYDQLILFLDFLEAKTKVVKTSELRNYQSKKLDIVLEILKDVKAEIYVSGTLGRDYVDANRFKQENIKLYFQDYHHPTYQQLWGDFAPYMSVIDLLFNEGSNSQGIIFKNNISKGDLLTKPELYE